MKKVFVIFTISVLLIFVILFVRDFKYEEGVFHKERLLKFK